MKPTLSATAAEIETTWEIAELLLSGIETEYRRERLKPGGAQPLMGEARNQAISIILQVCQLYRHAPESQRRQIWSFFEQTYSLATYAEEAGAQAAEQFLRTKEIDWLELALLAWVIRYYDYRDNYLNFGGLYLEAIRLGCAPMPAFSNIGLISFGTSSAILTGFEQSAFYHADVAPLVPDARRGHYRYLGRDYGLPE